jgi:AbrB family looped-hinge helix DNA binding protein
MPKTRAKLEGTVRVGAKHQVTIPHRISRALRLKKGDHMLLRLVGGRVEMIPVSLIPKDQLWFWTPEWQKKEHEADVDIARGNVKTSDSVEELMKDLRSPKTSSGMLRSKAPCRDGSKAKRRGR